MTIISIAIIIVAIILIILSIIAIILIFIITITIGLINIIIICNFIIDVFTFVVSYVPYFFIAIGKAYLPVVVLGRASGCSTARSRSFASCLSCSSSSFWLETEMSSLSAADSVSAMPSFKRFSRSETFARRIISRRKPSRKAERLISRPTCASRRPVSRP